MGACNINCDTPAVDRQPALRSLTCAPIRAELMSRIGETAVTVTFSWAPAVDSVKSIGSSCPTDRGNPGRAAMPMPALVAVRVYGAGFKPAITK